eukprot:1159087-Pelagomonas_calceolata.AAC.5
MHACTAIKACIPCTKLTGCSAFQVWRAKQSWCAGPYGPYVKSSRQGKKLTVSSSLTCWPALISAGLAQASADARMEAMQIRIKERLFATLMKNKDHGYAGLETCDNDHHNFVAT